MTNNSKSNIIFQVKFVKLLSCHIYSNTTILRSRIKYWVELTHAVCDELEDNFDRGNNSFKLKPPKPG
jgi:hypothetical protein